VTDLLDPAGAVAIATRSSQGAFRDPLLRTVWSGRNPARSGWRSARPRTPSRAVQGPLRHL